MLAEAQADWLLGDLVGESELRNLRIVGQQLNLYRRSPSAAESEESGGGIRDVDDAVLRNRAAVVHADYDGSVITEIGDPHQRSHWKAAVRAGHGVHVKIFAAGGLLALEELAIPGRAAKLVPAMLWSVLGIGGLF